METVVEERRRHPRRPPEETEWRQMRLRTGDMLTIVDISASGAMVETGRRLLPGVKLVVHLAAAECTVRIDARVVRCSVWALAPEGGVRYRGALEFVEPPHSVATCEMGPNRSSMLTESKGLTDRI